MRQPNLRVAVAVIAVVDLINFHCLNKIYKMAKLEIQVEGMSCGGCERTVQRLVGSITGVIQVSAHHTSNLVEIEYQETAPDLERLKEVIEQAGYRVVG